MFDNSSVYRNLGNVIVGTIFKHDSQRYQFYTPIASIKTVGLSDVVYKIRGTVISYAPDVKSFIVTSESRNNAKRSTSQFLFELKIKDSSDTLRVVVFGENAEVFLDVKAQDFANDDVIKARIANRIDKLVSNNTIIDAFIQTYPIKVGHDTLAAHGHFDFDKTIIGYQLIDTVLVDT
ncbi:hypothetical protein RFI_16889 [Reticulomyxa filosa]|uniref:Uncharacterized protein n=1 Tax=Reticulomyxa filosa TaxID=46433 RepID=X6N3J7_RETFI|nr:hypothetical protein RFI_16889 [Reticulomyxa filosa]|eukprot:ETO20329.1 hypothetical protein RFI_16889 [Reticulomyxa filosa]